MRPMTSMAASAATKTLLFMTRTSLQLRRQDTELDVAGARVFDLQIALTAFENGAAELWTHDQGFTRVPGLRFVDPLA